ELRGSVTARAKRTEHVVEVGRMEHRVRRVAAERLVKTKVRSHLALLADAAWLEPVAPPTVRTRRDILHIVHRHEVLEQGCAFGGEVAAHGARRDAEPPGEQLAT